MGGGGEQKRRKFVLTCNDKVGFSADGFAELVGRDAPVRSAVRCPFALGRLQEQQGPVRQQGFAHAVRRVHETAVPVPPDFRSRLSVGLAVQRGRFRDLDDHVCRVFHYPGRSAARYA